MARKPAIALGNQDNTTQVGAVSKISKKDGNTARANASKRGTPVGPTYVSSPSNKGAVTESTTDIKSKRGNYYQITETKKRVPFGRDPKTKTSIGQWTNHPADKRKKK
jgi:hypothetical protein